jgi:hypothetical protein
MTMSESEVDLSEYYSGGYLLIRAAESEWETLRNDVRFPNKFISLSDCLSYKLDISWGWTPGNRQAALDFGIPETKLDEFVRWCGAEHEPDLAMWNMFYSTAAARRFIQRFLQDTRDLYLIGIGLHREITLFDWRTGINDEKAYGIGQRLEQHLAIEEGGTPLGYEIASYDYYGSLSHSWLCGGLQNDMSKLFGIIPNQYGFIPSYAEARQVYDWIEEDDMQGHRGEPEPYYPWLLIAYPLASNDD